ncbi:MAG: YciI family protein [Pseudolysinimonas sp.]
MEFDSFVVSLLILRDDAPLLDDGAASALQDAHLDYLATLHEQGHLMAAGPLGHDGFRGLSILRGTVDEVRALKEADPAVQIGRFHVVVMPWQVPAGAVHFTPTRFPHSIADVEGD